MTTPSERMRALRWGAQLFEAMAVDSVVPPELQRRAAELSRRFPSQPRLLGLLADREAWAAREVAQVLFDAGLLFETTTPTGQIDPSTRHLWRGTVRRYPGRSNGWHRPEDFELFRVVELLACERAIDSPDFDHLMAEDQLVNTTLNQQRDEPPNHRPVVLER